MLNNKFEVDGKLDNLLTFMALYIVLRKAQISTVSMSRIWGSLYMTSYVCVENETHFYVHK